MRSSIKSTIAATAMAAGLIGLTSCATREAVAVQRSATPTTVSTTATTGRTVDIPMTSATVATPVTVTATTTAPATTTVLSPEERVRITWDWAGGVEGEQHPEIKDCVISKTLARWPDFPEHAHSAHGDWPAAPEFNEIRAFRADCVAAITPTTTTALPAESAAEKAVDDMLDETFRAGAAQAGRTLTDNQVFCMREATKRDARIELVELAAGQHLTDAEIAHLHAIWNLCL